jgi:UDP-3-O-[3-hydroxymyristoyl] glucosamine N-acyltransferase
MVNASEIAKFLNKPLIGNDINVQRASSINNLKSNSVVFVNKPSIEIKDNENILYLLPLNMQIKKLTKCSYILIKNPRLAFAKVVQTFFEKKFSQYTDKTAQISSTAKIGKNVYIGKYVVIGDNVIIGDGTIIRDNVIIHHDIQIGKKCYIKSGVVIGEDGFGFDFDEDSTPIKLPHLGSVKVGNFVEIGANTVIARGTLDDTIIEDHVKIDALVHIAHNCIIGEKSSLIAGTTLSGSVRIGKRCWIAPNSTIYQKKVIGDDVQVGLGAIVINNIKNKDTVMGLEAINVFELYKFKLKHNYKYNQPKKERIKK